MDWRSPSAATSNVSTNLQNKDQGDDGGRRRGNNEDFETRHRREPWKGGNTAPASIVDGNDDLIGVTRAQRG